MINAIKEQIQKVYNLFLKTILPPTCSGCRTESVSAHLLCAACWNAVHFIQKPFCSKCGVPMAFASDQMSCVECLMHPPAYDLGRSTFIYSDLGRDLVLRLKHSDATYLPKCLAPWIKSTGQDFWPTADYIIPVPLHRWRLLKRQYNQATLLARAVSGLVNVPVLTNVLMRRKATESQGHKSVKDRKKNVDDAFYVKGEILKGKTIVLLDDVWTTGATLNACTKVLRKAGAHRIYLLTLARVVKE